MGFNWETVVQIVILILALRALHMVSAEDSCAEVRRTFTNNGIGPGRLVPYNAFEGKDLRICPNTKKTCCTRQMETKFQLATKKDIEIYLQYKLSTLTYNFRSFAEKFQDDVIETLSLSHNLTRNKVHQTLQKKISSKSLRAALAAVDRLFRPLGLRTRGEEVKKAFNKFADKLFLILLEDKGNSTKSDSKYEKCVAKQRSELHPFMDIPTVSAANLSIALELARALHKGLAAGAEAVNVTTSLVLSKSCQQSLVRMRFCSHCYAITLIKPCHGLCKNIIRGCFAGISEFDQYWNYYVGSLVGITQRMGSEEPKYNVEIALEDFQDKLSSSLSIVLENITTLRETADKRCKKSRALKRSRRNTDRTFPNPDTILDDEDNEGEKLDLKTINEKNRRFNRRRSRITQSKFNRELMKLRSEPLSSSMGGSSTDAPIRPLARPPHEVLFNPEKRNPRKAETPIVVKKKSQMHNRIQRFIASLELSLNFYRHLPDDLCGETSGRSIAVANHESCWDGKDIVQSYVKDVVPIGYEDQAKNPEVQVLKVEDEVIQAIEKLRKSTTTLFVAAGNKDVPGIVLQSPEFKPREGKTTLYSDKNIPCDDEDDCEEFGSGDNIDHSDEKDETNIEIVLVENDDVTNETVIIDVKSPRNNDVDADVTFEEDEKDKQKGKGKKDHKNGKKGRGTHHSRARNVVTTTPGNSASKNTNFSSFSWLLLVLLPVLRFTNN